MDPKTLIRAARDHVKRRPALAFEVALAALHWMANSAGFELTGADVSAARDRAVATVETLGVGALVSQQIADNLAGNSPSAL